MVHFDAHHDMGYSAQSIREQLKKGITDCGSWLFHALREKLVEDITLVYPDWRSDEWGSGSRQAHLRPYKKRIRAVSWSEWLKESKEQRDVVVTNVARSGAWVPPWFDDDFARLIDAMPCFSSNCLDCDMDTPGGHNACTPRARGWEEPFNPPPLLAAGGK